MAAEAAATANPPTSRMEEESMDSIAHEALRCTARGWFVFPVQGSSGKRGDDAKRPIKGLRWSQESTIDDQQVAFWFSGTNYGIGVDLAPSGLLVVDVDHPDKFDLDPALLAGAWIYRGNPDRMSYLFSVPDGRTVPQAKHPWGEVKAAGGYVVLPPSFHPVGGTYEWLEQPGEEPGPASDALLAAIKPLPPKASSGPRWTGQPATKAQQAWVLGLLDAMVRRVASAGQGQRNIQLNSAAMAMGHYVPHAIEELTVRQALMGAARTCGLTRDDGERACSNTITSGLSAGMAQPQQPQSTGALLFEDLPAPDEDLFDATSVLGHVRAYARARQVSPWGLLGAVLARAVAEVPPNVVLPGITGAEVSIAIYTALVGPSGSGKSSSFGLSGTVLARRQWLAHDISPGSGEGLLDAFLRPPEGKKDAKQAMDDPWSRLRVNPHALLWADEIQHLGAVQSRQGATIAAKLRSMWSGATVGDTNSHAGGRSRHLPGHSYRLCVVAGMQPKLAGVLLDDTDAGTPQRWLWMPVIDPLAPHWRELPDDPGPLPWAPPSVPVQGRELYRVPVCDEAVALIRDMHWKRATGQAEAMDEALDGHALLSRLKVAVALAVLHGECAVTEQWWTLAEEVMKVSNATRGRVASTLSVVARERQRAQGAGDAEREMAKTEAMVNRQADRWAGAVARLVTGKRDHLDKKGRVAHPDGGPCHEGCIRYHARGWRGVTGDRHEAVALATDRAVDRGLIVRRADGALLPPPGE